jgi:hypothetical protein
VAALLGLITAKDLTEMVQTQDKVNADSMEGVDGPPEIDNEQNVEVKDE